MITHPFSYQVTGSININNIKLLIPSLYLSINGHVYTTFVFDYVSTLKFMNQFLKGTGTCTESGMGMNTAYSVDYTFT